MAGRKPTLQRQGRTITVQGGDEVYTRLSKREYERRRNLFDNPDLANYNKSAHLEYYDYDEWVDWGNQGGRPRKWTNEAERKRIERTTKKAQAKLDQNLPLTNQEKELLGLVKKRPGAYKSPLGRAMIPTERKAKWKAARKS
jgi:hypothetical protein